jgi:cellulose synthase/poly-beta-1,6-N-acetylglucosamine synthase-like glycosyltransferase
LTIFLVIFFANYTSLLFLLLGIGLTFQWKKERTYLQKGNKLKLAEITVLIPFRNEEKRIAELLESILKSSVLPSKFLFIDDHSSDKSVAKISATLKDCPFEILTVPAGEFGKKKALRIGIEAVETPFFLTLDADVAFAENYFEQFEKLTPADLYILPAVLISKRWFEHFFEVDLLLVNALNTGLSGLKRPIIASGANLLVRKSAFEQFDCYETHAHIPSGDDIYLLRDFRNAKADVRVCTIPTFQITTETPQSFSEFIHQRLRWVAKTGDVNDHLSTTLALIQLILTIGFFGILTYLIIQFNYYLAGLTFAFKISIDMLLFLPFFYRFNRMTAWWILPIYQLVFPFYNVLILILLPFFKPVWKGRISGIVRKK